MCKRPILPNWRCYQYLYGLLAALDSCLDCRLVVIMHRHRARGLFLSELGGYLKREQIRLWQGTKRISRLLHSSGTNCSFTNTLLLFSHGSFCSGNAIRVPKPGLVNLAVRMQRYLARRILEMLAQFNTLVRVLALYGLRQCLLRVGEMTMD